jgi:hypothetical protein
MPSLALIHKYLDDMTTLEVQPKAFPTSIPSTISRIQTTTGAGSILSSETDNTSLRVYRAAQETEESRTESGLNVATQDENISSSSRILATRREVSGRTPKRPPGRSPFAGFGTGPYRAAYRSKDVAYSRDSSPRNGDNNGTKFSPGDWENTFKSTEFVPSGNQSRYHAVQREIEWREDRIRRDRDKRIAEPVAANGKLESFPVPQRGSQRSQLPLNRDGLPFSKIEDYTDSDSDSERHRAIRAEERRRRRQLEESRRGTRIITYVNDRRGPTPVYPQQDQRTEIIQEEFTDSSGRRVVRERHMEPVFSSDEIFEQERYQRETEYYDRPEIPSPPMVIRQRAPEPQRIIIRERSPPSPLITSYRGDDEHFDPFEGSSPNKGNELGTLSQKFGNMGWKTRKGNPLAQISSTISKDNTLRDDVRNAKLPADFAKKRQRFAFGGEEAAEKSENLTSSSDDDPYYYRRDVRDPHRR